MFNQDDDEYQLQEEFDNIESDKQKNDGFGNEDFNFGDVNDYTKQAAQLAGFKTGDSGNKDSGSGQKQLFDGNTEANN